MRNLILFVFSLFLMITLPIAKVSAQNESLEVKTGIVTLYAKNRLAQTFCFKDGKYGTPHLEFNVRNPCSDIGFNTHLINLDSFSVGIGGEREGKIIDLGKVEELHQKYKEIVGKEQVFASIQAQKEKVFILKERKKSEPNELFEIVETKSLFQDDTGYLNNINVKLGNIYILRLWDGDDKDFEKIVKFIVTDYQPDRFATIRWQVIFDNEDNNNEK